MCHPGYMGDGKTCFPVPDKPSQVTVIGIAPSEVSVGWNLANTSIVKHLTVEYMGFGIHGTDWEVIVVQPYETTTRLTDLQSDSTYLVRIGRSRDCHLLTRVLTLTMTRLFFF